MEDAVPIPQQDVANGGRRARAQRYIPEAVYLELMSLLEEHGRKATRQNKIVSHETFDVRKDHLLLVLRELRGLGYKLESVYNLKQKHVSALAKAWEKSGLSASTIANRISSVRALSLWIGKPGMIQKAADYVQNPGTVQRMQATTEDKSWSAAGVDIDAMTGLVEQYDRRVGLMVRLMKAFGLRKKEAAMFRPWKADLGLAIRVRDGTKGGRERVVPIETDEQRAVLAQAKIQAPRANDHIGYPDLNLEQSLRRVNYVFEKFGLTKRGLGVTAHGLRHEHLNNLYEAITGVPSPVRSNSVTGNIDRHLHDVARARVSQEAGHNRLNISDAYIGARQLPVLSAAEKEQRGRYRELLSKEELLDSEAAELGRLAKGLAGKGLV
jgi:site-specific recombinase XerC